jgi:thiol-disulfide isomerase
VVNNKVGKKEYRGQRSVEALVEYINDLMQDSVKHISQVTDIKSIPVNKPVVLAFFDHPPQSASHYNIYRKVASDLKDDCHFYWITDPLKSYYNTDGSNNLILFKPPRTAVKEKDIKYPGSPYSYDELSTWTTDKCIPLVREITFENAEELTEEGLPFLILFHDPADKASVEQYTQVVHKELSTESGSINFLTADGHQFAHPLLHLGKTTKDLPLIAIDSFRHMYLFSEFKDIK